MFGKKEPENFDAVVGHENDIAETIDPNLESCQTGFNEGTPSSSASSNKSTDVSGGLQTAEVDPEFRKALLKVLEQYEPVFKKLAES